jgi:hypothetical protein
MSLPRQASCASARSRAQSGAGLRALDCSQAACCCLEVLSSAASCASPPPDTRMGLRARERECSLDGAQLRCTICAVAGLSREGTEETLNGWKGCISEPGGGLGHGAYQKFSHVGMLISLPLSPCPSPSPSPSPLPLACLTHAGVITSRRVWTSTLSSRPWPSVSHWGL